MWMVSRNIGPWEYSKKHDYVDFKSDLNWGKIWVDVACKIIHVRLFHSKSLLVRRKKTTGTVWKTLTCFIVSKVTPLFFSSPPSWSSWVHVYFVHKSFIDEDHTAQPQECDLVCWHGLGIISELSRKWPSIFNPAKKLENQELNDGENGIMQMNRLSLPIEFSGFWQRPTIG